MNSFKREYIGFFFLLIFITSYFLPVVNNIESNLLGLHFFGLQLLDFPFSSSLQEYIFYFIKTFLIIGIILLFLNRWLHINKYAVFLLSLVVMYSPISYLLAVNNVYDFSYGYWLWFLSIVALVVDTNLVAFSKKKIPLPK